MVANRWWGGSGNALGSKTLYLMLGNGSTFGDRPDPSTSDVARAAPKIRFKQGDGAMRPQHAAHTGSIRARTQAKTQEMQKRMGPGNDSNAVGLIEPSDAPDRATVRPADGGPVLASANTATASTVATSAELTATRRPLLLLGSKASAGACTCGSVAPAPALCSAP